MMKYWSKRAGKNGREQMNTFCNGINHTGRKWEWSEWGRGGGRLIIRGEMRVKVRVKVRQRGVWWTVIEGDDSPEGDRQGERVTCDPSGCECSFIASPSPSLLSSPAALTDNPTHSSSSLLELICLQRVRVQWRVGSLGNYSWGGRYEGNTSIWVGGGANITPHSRAVGHWGLL